MKGNLCPNGAVIKLSGKELDFFQGQAVVFDSEQVALDEILAGKTVKKNHVVVIRYEGPKGAPGMPEMLLPGAALVGQGLGENVALVKIIE